MKVELAVRETEGSLPGETINMSLDENGIDHILSVLTNLYSNETRAVVREYATNARDAMIDANRGDHPIEITTPTSLAPQFRVKDTGIGMDINDIRNIYSKYGASTKRDSNEVVGMLGLGCKSALAYGDTFTLSAVKNGQKIEVAVGYNEDGGLSMQVVDEYETDEPNGVEVIVPVTGYNDFAREANDFFYYWPKGTVLVNGEEPESIFDDPKVFWIANDIAIIPQQNEDKIVMGNVAYPMEAKYDYTRRYSVIGFVPIGAVNFVPSREALLFNTKTKATIAKVMERVETEATNAVTKQVEGANNKPEALAIYTRFAAIFQSRFKVEAQYKGQEIPANMECPLVGSKGQEFITVKASALKNYREKGWHRMNAYPSSVWGKTIFIRGYDGADFSPYKRKKMDQWIEEMNEKGTPVPEHETVVFTARVPQHHWIEKGRIFDWQQIKDQKIVREQTKTQSGRVSGSYEGYVDGAYQREILADDINTNYPILYSEKSYGYSSQAWDIVKREHNHFTFVEIGSNRIAKFTRDFPTAKTLNEYAKELAQQWEKGLTEDEKLHLAIVEDTTNSAYGATSLSGLKQIKDDLDDPELVEAIEVVTNKNVKLVNARTRFGSFVNPAKDVEWDNPLLKYPLLSDLRLYGTMNQMQANHVTLYLNAVYTAGQEAQ